MPSATFNPRQRLSILTNASLGHDVSAALSVKIAASNASEQRSYVYGETAAPPPSPIDFSFAGASSASSSMKEERRGSESN
ncbi:hypothetical protein G6514_003363 [Epicoccum nigrum]|jgi:hypothetical protein|nr:hypothetical protein G6514_003363 [Epicoccum nigrum]